MKLWLNIILALGFLSVAVLSLAMAFTWIPHGTLNFVIGVVNLFLFWLRLIKIRGIMCDPEEMKKLLKK
jgi:hypothetical protein